MSGSVFYQRMTRCESFVLLLKSLVLDDAIFGMVYVTCVLTRLVLAVLTQLLDLVISHRCWTEGYWANQAHFALK